MAARPSLFTRDLSGLSQSSDPNSSVGSPAEQRDDAKRNFLKAMRPLPTQHYWNVYFDKQSKDQKTSEEDYKVELERLGTQIESVQDFWKYNNNTPVEQIKTRESIYLFKQGFRPVWEDRRNINGGAWTFRVPKAIGRDVWNHVQLLAIGEELQSVLDDNDQICGVGFSVRFNSHLISVWHRDSSKKKSTDGILNCIMEKLPAELRPKSENAFYKRHQDHAGFNPPPELKAVLDSQKRAEEREKEKVAAAAAET
ncbi:translation initiation factor eIF4e [Sodiomyces alkalinus F11]|uniref:Translation initiation factor eIF4e n=1 Tax=Sodiomyces alkalinus (strain CBS 110278 / VKM F-3762 / F11) TaxID=1314773 RepID=A0A3N2Q964_SODAK|nr:translation initiation factor eIF4e [Sodiomyces alkalinus F11]ROT43165.1 translation initiation factor eIF4e [Sodiomyces alkalinus F11]